MVVFMAMIYYDKRIQSKISNDKGLKRQSPEETRHKLPRVSSQWSHTGCASFLQPQIVTTHVKCRLPQKLIRDSVPRVFYQGLVTWTPPAWQVPKIQTPRRRAGARHKPYCLYKELRLSESAPLLSSWWELACTLRSQTPAPGQPSKQGFQRIAVRTAVLSLLHGQVVSSSSPLQR